MAKVGRDSNIGTAEGALLGRAAHALHAKDPILDDFWAVELLTPEAQALVRDPEHYRSVHAPGASPMASVSAAGFACLRFAEDEVERLLGEGVRQYVVLGAGLDTFALRRKDLVDRLRVFEVDHPDVQKLKRERVAAASVAPASLPEFVPVDFEVTSVAEGLLGSRFDPEQRSVFSWMNTLPYLSEDAVAGTLEALARVAAPGSRLIANYVPQVPPTPEQAQRMQEMSAYAASVGEDHRKFWKPEALVSLLAAKGFETVEHATERDLTDRYFQAREDGLAPGLPIRVLISERSA
jgi:methyltransferase (TIGR00027 family)